LSTPAQEQSGGCQADLQRRREASFGRQPSRLLTRIARSLAPSLAPSVARSPRLVRLWPLVPTTAVLALLLGPQILVSTIAIGVILVLVAEQGPHHHRPPPPTPRRTQIIEALDVLAADLTAGRPPIDALEGAASISPDFRVAHAAAKLGGDVPDA